MSFLNIKNLKERNATVAEYEALKKRLKNRNLTRKRDADSRRRYLEETHKPATKASKEMADKITDELKPIRKELNDLNSLIARPKAVAKRRKKPAAAIKRKFEPASDESSSDQGEEEEWELPYVLDPLSKIFLDTYKGEETRKSKLDLTFGLRKVGEAWKIGSEVAKVGSDDSIHVGGRNISGNSWVLVAADR